VFIRIVIIIVSIADSIRDNESSVYSLAISNIAKSSLLLYLMTENSTSREAFCKARLIALIIFIKTLIGASI
jgi:hypothetical protein